MLSLPALATGVAGVALGFVLGEFRRRIGPPTVPLAQTCAREAVLVCEVKEAHRQAVEAHDTVGVVVAERDEARRALAAALGELEAEQELHHEQRTRAERAEASPPWLQQPLVAFHRPIPFGAVLVPGPGCPS